MFTARYGLNLSIKIRLTLIVQVVSCRRLAAAARFRSKVSPCEICGGLSGTWTGLQIPPVSTIPSMFHSHLHLYVAASTCGGNVRSLATFHKAMLLGIRGALDGKEQLLLLRNGLSSSKRSVHTASSGTSLAVH